MENKIVSTGSSRNTQKKKKMIGEITFSGGEEKQEVDWGHFNSPSEIFTELRFSSVPHVELK